MVIIIYFAWLLSVHFGSFQLSADGSKLLYIAEKKKTESVSYFKKLDKDKDKDAPVKVKWWMSLVLFLSKLKWKMFYL